VLSYHAAEDALCVNGQARRGGNDGV